MDPTRDTRLKHQVSRRLTKTVRQAIPCDITWDEATALSYAPPRSRVVRDPDDGRWSFWHGVKPAAGPRLSVSKSWGWEGDDRQCVMPVLRVAWARHERLTAHKRPYLFGEPEAGQPEAGPQAEAVPPPPTVPSG